MKRYRIYITNAGWPKRDRFKSLFGFDGITVNGEAEITVGDDYTEHLLQAAVVRGMIQIREINDGD